MDLGDAELKNGLKNARDFTGFFTLPAFRELCKTTPDDMGLPGTRRAYEEACMKPSPKAEQDWSHPAVYHAGRATGWHELASLPDREIFKRFEYNYDLMKKRLADGEDLSVELPKAIPASVPKYCTRDENQNRMMELREAMGL